MSSPQWLEEMAMDTVLNNITVTTSGCHTGWKKSDRMDQRKNTQERQQLLNNIAPTMQFPYEYQCIMNKHNVRKNLLIKWNMQH